MPYLLPHPDDPFQFPHTTTTTTTASFIGPISILSLAYFACALGATPICTYAACTSTAFVNDRSTESTKSTILISQAFNFQSTNITNVTPTGVSPKARRGICISLACLAVAFLLLQGSMVAVARVGAGQAGPGVKQLIELLAIEEAGPVSFRLLGFLTRDLAVLMTCAVALQLLRPMEEGQQAWRRLALATPVRILPKASFLDCNWRMLTLGVLVVSR